MPNTASVVVEFEDHCDFCEVHVRVRDAESGDRIACPECDSLHTVVMLGFPSARPALALVTR